MRISGKTVVILGLGRQGTALAQFMSLRGARVRVSDMRREDQLSEALAELQGFPIEYTLGSHPPSLLRGADTLYLSGGVPVDTMLAREAIKHGIPLSNDSQLFLEFTPCPVVGITGSAGKTTTTALVGEMGKRSQRYRKVWVGGNIGKPLLADLDNMGSEDLAAMELSSFQLEIMTASPSVAGVLNITPNHLDRHGTMEAYIAAKSRILDGQKQGDCAVLGWDDPNVRTLHSRTEGNCWGFSSVPNPAFENGCYLVDEMITVREHDMHDTVSPTSEVRLPGDHNVLNVLAACALAGAVGVEVAAMRSAIREFTGMPHRLELVRKRHGVLWINDSIATAPERTVAAINSFNDPIVLLLGGRDKQLPWDELATLINRRVKCVILFGEAAGLIENNLVALHDDPEYSPADVTGSLPAQSRTPSLDKGPGVKSNLEGSTVGETATPGPYPPNILRAAGLNEAVQLAAEVTREGDLVLLSPGCTSFDEFMDFSVRGDRFRELVGGLS